MKTLTMVWIVWIFRRPDWSAAGPHCPAGQRHDWWIQWLRHGGIPAVLQQEPPEDVPVPGLQTLRGRQLVAGVYRSYLPCNKNYI